MSTLPSPKHHSSPRTEKQQTLAAIIGSRKEPSRLLLFFYTALLTFTFCLPLISISFRPFPQTSLYGLTSEPQYPLFSRRAVVKESFQRSTEQWLMKKNGLWEWLVKTSNQMNLTVFRQASSSYSSPLFLGEDGHIMQTMYLRSFNKRSKVGVNQIRKKIRLLQQLQATLAAHGVRLLVVVSTNALALYPELVPASYADPTRFNRKNSYETMLPLLSEAGIPVFDAHHYLNGLKTEYPFRLFEPTASHWNHVASCRVTKEFIRVLGNLLERELPNFTCAEYSFVKPQVPPDQDLLEIANLLYPAALYRPTPYVKHTAEDTGRSYYQPKVLFVGTSFVFTMLAYLEAYNVLDEHELWFYNKKKLDQAKGDYVPFKKNSVDWAKLLSYDAIVLEVNQASMGNLGFGFIKEAAKKLPERKTPSTDKEQASSARSRQTQ